MKARHTPVKKPFKEIRNADILVIEFFMINFG